MEASSWFHSIIVLGKSYFFSGVGAGVICEEAVGVRSWLPAMCVLCRYLFFVVSGCWWFWHCLSGYWFCIVAVPEQGESKREIWLSCRIKSIFFFFSWVAIWIEFCGHIFVILKDNLLAEAFNYCNRVAGEDCAGNGKTYNSVTLNWNRIMVKII